MSKKILIILISAVVVILIAFAAFFVVPLSSEDSGGVGKVLPLDPKSVMIDEETGIKYVKDQLVVSFTADADIKNINKIIASINGEIVGYITELNIYQIKIQPSVTLIELDKIKDDVLNKNTLISSVSLNTLSEPNYDSKTPVDPWDERYEEGDVIWDEKNPNGSNWGFEAIKAPSAWQYNDKIGKVKIGVVDFGFYINNQDLKINKNNATGVNSILGILHWKVDPTDHIINSHNIHGTFIAGIIGAIPDNKYGIAGMIKNRDLSVCRTDGQAFSIRLGTYWCLEKGANIINLSSGMYISDKRLALINQGKMNIETDKIIKDEIKVSTDFLRKVKENTNDFLIVNAAGNNGIDARWSGGFCSITDPELRKNILIVGGCANKTENGNHMGFERYETEKASSNYGNSVDVVAPGEDIFSLNGALPGCYKASGTSVSAPFVTGLAGLIEGSNPNLSCQEIKEIIVNTAEEAYEYKGIKYKMINAQRSIEKALNILQENSEGSTITDEDLKNLALESDRKLVAVVFYNNKNYLQEMGLDIPDITKKADLESFMAKNWTDSFVKSIWDYGWSSKLGFGFYMESDSGFLDSAELSIVHNSNSSAYVRGTTPAVNGADKKVIREMNFQLTGSSWKACSIKYFDLNGNFIYEPFIAKPI